MIIAFLYPHNAIDYTCDISQLHVTNTIPCHGGNGVICCEPELQRLFCATSAQAVVHVVPYLPYYLNSVIEVRVYTHGIGNIPVAVCCDDAHTG